MISLNPRAQAPAFRRRFWGYDPAEVDQALAQAAAEQERGRERLARLDALLASRTKDPAGTVIEDAKRQAEQIRLQAEARSRRLVEEVERRAQALYRERAEAIRRETDRLKALGQVVERCLEASGAALHQAREQLATELSTAADASPAEPAVASQRSGASRTPAFGFAWRHPRRASLALVAVLAAALVGAPRFSHLGILPSRTAPADATDPAIRPAPPTPSPLAVPSETDGEAREPATPLGASGPEVERLVLTLTASQTCWLRAQVDRGQALERLMPPGESIVLHAYEAVTLTIGDASALSMLINNQPSRPLGEDGEVVDLEITRDNYAAYLRSDWQAR